MREIGSMLGVSTGRGIYSAVPRDTLVVIADAHLGAPGGASVEAFHRFLRHVPSLGDHLVIAGDLFEFLFVHARVLPRAAFPTLAALRALRDAGVRLSVVGGNHDRWARDLWERELDAAFDPEELTLGVGPRTVLVRHGDGLLEPDVPSRVLGWLVRRPMLIGAVRWVHPDLLAGAVDRLARRLGARGEDLPAAHAAQRVWAHARLAAPQAPDVLLLAHTHIAVAEMPVAARWYVNPGAWFDGGRHAIVPAEGPPGLAQWSG